MSQLPVLVGSPNAVQVCGCGSDPGGGERGGRTLHEGDLLLCPHQLHWAHMLAWARCGAFTCWLRPTLSSRSFLVIPGLLASPGCHGWSYSALFAPVWLLPCCHAGVPGPRPLQSNQPVLLLTVRYWLFSFVVVVGLPLLSSLDVASTFWNKM